MYHDIFHTNLFHLKAKQLLSDIEESFVDLMEENQWLEGSTKQRALNKLSSMVENVDYREWIMNDTLLDTIHNLVSERDREGGKDKATTNY